jgi:hypothetical protein
MSVTVTVQRERKHEPLRFGSALRKMVKVPSIRFFCQSAETVSLQLNSRFLGEACRVSKASRTTCHSSASCLNLWSSSDSASRC